jgi:hypothetical protein
VTRYYESLAAAFVRGQLPEAASLGDIEAVEMGVRAGLRIHKFKVTSLERVRRVLGILRSLAPRTVLDVGSGRGAFLWPLLAEFTRQRLSTMFLAAGARNVRIDAVLNHYVGVAAK